MNHNVKRPSKLVALFITTYVNTTYTQTKETNKTPDTFCCPYPVFLGEFILLTRVRRTAKSDNWAFCPHGNNSAPTEWIFMKSDKRVFQQYVEKAQVSLNLIRITGTLHDDLCTVVLISRRIFTEYKMFHTKVVHTVKTHILRSVTFFPTIDPLMRRREKKI